MAEAVVAGDANLPVNNKDKVTLIFSGKSGAGKSTLITKLLKIAVTAGDVSEPEHPEEFDPTPEPVTQECKAYYRKENDVTLEVVDTVGLISSEDMSKNIKEIAAYTNRSADLLVYCLHVGPGMKFVDGNPAMMKALQKSFDKEIWGHCILVCTFSNLIWQHFSSQVRDRDNAVASYLKYIRKYAACFQHQLQEMGVQDIDVRTIFDNPVREKGRRTIVAVPAGLEFTDEVLPNIKQDETSRWMGIVIREMIKSCKDERRALFKKYSEGWEDSSKYVATAAAIAAGVLAIVAIAVVKK